MFNIDTLDAFTRAYIEAAIWTECNPDSNELDGKTIEDMSEEGFKQAIAECAAFVKANETLIRRAWYKSSTLYTADRAGHDFWLTRNGHGAGFWDRGLGEIGDKLTEAAKKFPSIYLWLGEDGKLYFE